MTMNEQLDRVRESIYYLRNMLYRLEVEITDVDALRALQEDKEMVEHLLALLESEPHKETIEYIWTQVRHMPLSFGGYVGGEKGKTLNEAVYAFLEAMSDLVAQIRKR